MKLEMKLEMKIEMKIETKIQSKVETKIKSIVKNSSFFLGFFLRLFYVFPIPKWEVKIGHLSGLNLLLALGCVTFAEGKNVEASELAAAGHTMYTLGDDYGDFDRLMKEVENRTSMDLDPRSQIVISDLSKLEQVFWLWTRNADLIRNDQVFKPEILTWLKRGGFLILEGSFTRYQLQLMTDQSFGIERKKGVWKPIAPDHELMRSFYLLDALPSCEGELWYEFRYDDRPIILVIPNGFTASLAKNMNPAGCDGLANREMLIRTYINVSMIALTTDYKKDQVHLPEILKRLR